MPPTRAMPEGARDGPHGIARSWIDPMRTPFDGTEAFRRYGYGVERFGPGEEDLYAKALLWEQGFDGLPHVVTREQLDAHIRVGGVELFRGVSAKAHADQLRTGELYVGRGGLGGGIYAFGGPRGYGRAQAYAQDPGGVVLRMAVKSGARIIERDELAHQIAADRSSRSPTGHSTVRPDVRAALAQVPGLYAAYMGYDVVMEAREDVWLILNRTAIRIQEEDLAP